MSSKVLHDQLIQAVEHLHSIILMDINQKPPTTQQTCTLIAEYLAIYTKLEECYDQIVQTQRRINIKDLLLGTTARLLELIFTADEVKSPTHMGGNSNLPPPSNWELLSEIIMSQTQKNDIAISIPRIVRDLQGPSLAKREETISRIKQQYDETRIAAEMSLPPPLSLEEAVTIVQRAERARRARHETIIKRGIQQQQKVLSQQSQLSDREKSANIIKRFWWKYGQRNRETRQREEERELVGMKYTSNVKELEENVNKNMRRRKEEQRKRAQDLEAAEKASRTWLEDNRSPDEVRKFDRLSAAYYNRKKLAKKPMDFKRDLLYTLYVSIEEEEEEEDVEFDPTVKAHLEKITEEVRAKYNKDPKAKNKNQEQPRQESGGKKDKEAPVKSPIVEKLITDAETFDSLWSPENDPHASDNVSLELVKKEIWEQMVPELADKTREKLLRELKNLKILDARRCKKARPPRQRAKKQKKVKDPLGGKPHEEVLSEFVGYGVCKNIPRTTFRDFIGDYNVTHYTDLGDPKFTTSYAAIRNEVIIDAVLPFATYRTESFLPRGVLIVGPKGSGKTTLAHAAVNALGANFFDLSPEVLVGKELPSPKQLITQVIAFAKLFPPSVILIDDIDLMFGARKRANASKKFKGAFKKNLKKLRPPMGVLLIATTSTALPKAALSLFDKTVVIPKPNFSTRVAIWNYWLAKKNMLIPSISVNTLAYASEGCTAATIARAVSKAEQVKISRTEPADPVTDSEIVNFLADGPAEEWE